MATPPPPRNTPITLLNEIQEQAKLLRALLKQKEKRLASLPIPEKKHLRIIAIAEGSSKHALEIATPFLEEWIGLPIYVHDPESLEEKFTIARLYEDHLTEKDSISIYKDAYFIVVSQSGKTASVLRILETLTQYLDEPLPILTITNNARSKLAQAYPHHLFIGAGPEKSIAATKTLSATIMTLLLWGLHVAEKTKRMKKSSSITIQRQLARISDRLESLWEPTRMESIFRFTQKLDEVNHFVLLSKGPLTLVLSEAGLKLTETSSNIVYTDNSESFKHGPKVILSGINGKHPNSIYLVPTIDALACELYKDIESHFWLDPKTSHNNNQLAFEGDRVFFIAFENSLTIPQKLLEGLNTTHERVLTLPSASTVESLFVGLVTFQLISYYLAVIKGENPDNPTLKKAVT